MNLSDDKLKELNDLVYGETAFRYRMFGEELESEFFKVMKKYDLPFDEDAIAKHGFVIDRNYDIGKSTASITRHGKPVSRIIKWNDERVNSDCIDQSLKAILISNGVLCDVLEDLKRMAGNATKSLQELLDEPEQPDFNCTEISVDPGSNLINRVICFGKEYRTP